jgi:hypothetical protein
MGRSRTRLPVARWTAFAIAASASVMPTSPTPISQWRGRVGFVQVMDVDRRDVGVHRARRGWGSRYCRSARVDERFLGQRHADPHHDAAAKLATRRFRVGHPADVAHPDPTRHPHLARNWVGAAVAVAVAGASSAESSVQVTHKSRSFAPTKP